MPKRVVDGEALWMSNKLLQVPEKYRAEYANLIPLALANGSFECDPRKVWSRVYVYNRPSVTLQVVREMLDCFEQAKMLFRWKAEDGATWGYWVGIDKPGRLPKGTSCKNAVKGQPVPAETLETFISSDNQSVTGQGPVNDRQGLGLGLGLGLGMGINHCAAKTAAPVSGKSLPIAEGFEKFYAAYPKHQDRQEAERAWRKVKPEEAPAIIARVELLKIGEWQGKEKKFIPLPSTWLNKRRWLDEIETPGSNGTGVAPAIQFLPSVPIQDRKRGEPCPQKS